ncbi:MAG: hypothetical protein NTV68_08760, partial [Methanomicrobiales archaeon]|nr:hypothetical protein [Methanomicrobiales archaeon]
RMILTIVYDADAELIDTAEATRCSSDVSALINHYRAFSNTLPGELGNRGRGATSHGIICGKGHKDESSTGPNRRNSTRTRAW